MLPLAPSSCFLAALNSPVGEMTCMSHCVSLGKGHINRTSSVENQINQEIRNKTYYEDQGLSNVAI